MYIIDQCECVQKRPNFSNNTPASARSIMRPVSGADSEVVAIQTYRHSCEVQRWTVCRRTGACPDSSPTESCPDWRLPGWETRPGRGATCTLWSWRWCRPVSCRDLRPHNMTKRLSLSCTVLLTLGRIHLMYYYVLGLLLCTYILNKLTNVDY